MQGPRAAIAVAVLILGGCASPPAPAPAPAPPAAPAPVPPAPAAAPQPDAVRYRCEQDIAFAVRFGDGSAEIDLGPRGVETLLRDAGGVTPQQTVYSSTRLKAEFGLDPEGRGARLSFVSPPIEVRCTRD